MTADTIGIVVIQIIVGILLIAECFLYFGKKNEAGEVKKGIFVPIKYNVLKVVVYAIIFLSWFYIRVLAIGGDFTQTDLIYAVILLAELIVAIVIDCQPQLICENGIITRRGFMPWTQIQTLEATEKQEIVQLKVKEKAGFFQQIVCMNDEKRLIEEYVEEHMNFIPEAVEEAETEKEEAVSTEDETSQINVDEVKEKAVQTESQEESHLEGIETEEVQSEENKMKDSQEEHIEDMDGDKN